MSAVLSSYKPVISLPQKGNEPIVSQHRMSRFEVMNGISTIEQHHYIRTKEGDDPFLPIIQRLDSFESLGNGWDTYDAKPITARAILEARRFLNAIAERFTGRMHLAIPYFVAPLPYGGIQLEWRQPGKEIEIEIGPEGSFGYLTTINHHTNRQFEERSDVSSGEVLDLISRLFHGD